MLLRKMSAAVVMLCLLVLISGCRRKEEEEPDYPPEPEVETVETPEAFNAIPDTDPQVFITESPVSVGQYVSYLEETGIDVPQELAEKDPEEPVTGLEQGEAARLATWLLCRLPGESEWRKARDLVDSRPYPWDGPHPGADAPIHLVRDWVAGEEGEVRAREEKERLAQERLERLGDELNDFYAKIEDYTAAEKNRALEQWNSLKAALFSAIDRGKDAAEKSMLIERGHIADDILHRLQNEKLPIVALDKTDDPEKWEEAVSSYRERLKELRDRIEDEKGKMVEINRELSEQVRSLNLRLEDAGEKRLQTLERLDAEMPEAPGELDNLEQALDTRNTLEEFMAKAEKAGGEVAETMTVAMETVVPEIREKTDVSADEEELEKISASVKEREEALLRWSETADVEFEQEPHVLKELRDLKRLRARRKALERELELLEIILEKDIFN